MEVRSGALGETLTFVLEGFIRAKGELSPVMNVLTLLLICEFWLFGINELKHLVPSLLHYCYFREELIGNDEVRGFEVDVNSWLKTSGFKGDVRKDGRWESIRVEVLDLTVVKLKPGVHITCSFVWILIIIQVKLTELSHVSPPVIINQRSVRVLKPNV